MLNLPESLYYISFYKIDKGYYRRGILSATGSILFVDFLRVQITEINLLQLVPGLYVFLIFISFLLLLFSTTFISRLPFRLDTRKRIGSKTKVRMDFTIRLRMSLILFFVVFIIAIISIAPISLDSFDSYDEINLTNLWSFTEVLGIETILLIILIFLSQIPIILIIPFGTELDTRILPQVWKNLSFYIFVFSGFITPTIDGYTQLAFSTSAISLYLLVANIVNKRLYLKAKETYTLNF